MVIVEASKWLAGNRLRASEFSQVRFVPCVPGTDVMAIEGCER